MVPDDSGHGVAALAVSGVVARLLDFGYRISLVRLAGPELVGVFRIIFPIFGTLAALVGGGIPPAVANLIAQKHKARDESGIRHVMRMGLYITAGLGSAVAMVVMFTARFMATTVAREPRVSLGLVAIAPAVAIIPVSGVFRAYFQGTAHLMIPAWSQLVEEIAQVTAGLALVTVLVPHGQEMAVGAMAAAVTVSELAGLVVLRTAYRPAHAPPVGTAVAPLRETPPAGTLLHGTPPARTPPGAAVGDDLRYMVRFALPMTASRLLGSLSGTIGAILVPARLLAAGYTHSEAMTMFGQLTGMAGTVAYFPLTLSFAVAYAMVPQVAAAVHGSRRRVKEAVERAVRLSAAIALPSMVVMALLPAPLMRLFFGTTDAATLLLILAVGSPMAHLDMVMTSALQALGRPGVAFRNFLVGEAVNLGGIWLATGRHGGGIAGVAAAGVVATAIEAVLDYMAVNRAIGRKVSLAVAARPAVYAAGLAFILAVWHAWF